MSPNPSPPDLLQALGVVAAEAGRATLRFYGGDCAVSTKSDGSPVTQADLAAEAVILPALARLVPDATIVSEESAGAAPVLADRFFLVDPLDGTKEFLSRNGEFTVNIALIDKGAPSLGAVFAPALDRLWLGAVGLGAWFVAADGARTALTARPAPPALVALASRSHDDAQTNAWLRRLNVARRAAAGSSMKFCLIAAGEADVYPRLGRTMEWDTAAGDAVLRAAGGRVTQLDGRPLVYGKQAPGGEDFVNPGFVAWGDPALARATLG